MKKLIVLLLSALLVLTSCGGGDVSELSQDTVSYGEQSEASESEEVSKGVSAEESVPEEESEVSAEDTTVPEESEVSVPDETSKESEEYIPEETSKESDVSESEKTDAAVDQALKLIEEGKVKESYEVLYKSGTDAAKEMLKDFVVVYRKCETYDDFSELKSYDEYSYDENGFLIYEYSKTWHSVEYTYVNDENGNPIVCTQKDCETGDVETYEAVNTYDINGHLIKIAVGNHIEEYEYDTYGNVILKRTNRDSMGIGRPDTEYYKYEYNALGDIVKKYYSFISEPETVDYYEEHFYDNEGVLMKTEYYQNLAFGQADNFVHIETVTYHYDENGLLIKTIDTYLGNPTETMTTTYSDYLFFYRPQK